jgi:6-phosphogluconolactonase (cycloisomerase 2 family)
MCRRLLVALGGLALALASTAVHSQTLHELLYVTNWNTGTLSAFRVNAVNGVLTPVPGSPFPAVPRVEDLAIHPGNQLLYAVSTDGFVAGFRIEPATGALTAVPGSPFPAGIDGTSIVIDRAGQFLYTSDPGLGRIFAFAIDALTGSLSPVPGSPFAAGHNAGALVIDPSDRFLYASISSAPGDNVLAYAKGANGSLVRLPGEPVTGVGTRRMAVHPGGRYLYAANALSDIVSAYSIDPASGQIVPLPSAPFPAGDQPSALTVAAGGRHVYVANGSSATIGVYALDPQTGALGPAATTAAGGFSPDALVLDPSQRFAYVANRGSNGLTIHDVDQATGGLSLRSGGHATGIAPSGIAVTRFQAQQAPVLAITNVSVSEAAASVAFTVAVVPPPSQAVTVSFATVAGTAQEGADYQATSGTLSFGPGVGAQIVTVPILPDLLDEDPETFTVRLSAGSIPIAEDEGVATIVDDDPTPGLVIQNTSTDEGDTFFSFPVVLSAVSGRPVSVQFVLAPVTAAPGLDYGPVNGRLVIPAGTLQTAILVPVFEDHVAEGTEIVGVLLSVPANVTITDSTALGSIVDDDAAGLAVADVAVRERRAGPTSVTFTVSLVPTLPDPVSVQFTTEDGTATAGFDYTAAAGTLSFGPGQGSASATVSVAGDGLMEGPETFRVVLSAPVGAALGRAAGTVRILDPPGGGDFNRDGRADLLWRHEGSGEIALWYMNGATLLGGTFTDPPALPDPGWRIAGSNDFNQDGWPDILWQHSSSRQGVLWYMNGRNLVSGSSIHTTPDSDWRIVGTADLDLDGEPDLVGRIDETGLLFGLHVGPLPAPSFLTGALPLLSDADWEAVGLGDFNGDARADLLWRHRVSGQNAVWFLRGTATHMAFAGGSLLEPALPDTRWRVAALEDYDGDGDTDIVWRHSEAGQDVIWFMNGASLDHGAFTTTLPDTGWSLVGPR